MINNKSYWVENTLYLKSTGAEYALAGQYLTPEQGARIDRLYKAGVLSTSWDVLETSPKGLESLVGVRR